MEELKSLEIYFDDETFDFSLKINDVDYHYVHSFEFSVPDNNKNNGIIFSIVYDDYQVDGNKITKINGENIKREFITCNKAKCSLSLFA